MTKIQVLKKYFGFDEFRLVQEDAIDLILAKKDVLTILPTGSGKSLIYQLPSLMMDGVSVVISPLIALMQDQVMNLKHSGISAEMISSQNSNEHNNQVLTDLKNNKLKFLYVAPERLSNEYFLNELRSMNINFFVIDEAHCVSEWGHEFRDDYRKLGFLKNYFPDIPIACFTATATLSVQKDILATLSIDPKNVLKSKIQRKNLNIKVQKRMGNGKTQVKEFLNTHKDECGIVYCFTRKETEQLSEYLNKNGFDTLCYHAGIASEKRDKIFSDFKNEKTKIVVATIAFGMGIDKSNIRFVLHTSMPKTLENYVQEIGRAGRDTLPSDTLLLYSKADEVGKRRFIDELPESTYKTANYKKLELMYRFCISSKCRHKQIASYFDDKIDDCNTICDNCLADEIEYQDITIEAQKFCSCVLRCEQKFGAGYIIDVLRGSKIKRILDFGHDSLSVYGIGKEYSKDQWSSIVDVLLDIEALYQDEYKVLKLSNIGVKILKKEQNVQINPEFLKEHNSKETEESSRVVNTTLEEFKAIRKELAKEEGIPAYMVFSDKTLIEISNTLPTNDEEFLKISGVGEMKLEKYSEVFLNASKKLKESGAKELKILSKTYLETLSLIKEGLCLDAIITKREFKQSTIIAHIIALTDNEYMELEDKNRLLNPIKETFDKDIKAWVEEGLKSHDIATLKQGLSVYGMVFE
ncbi:MAG: ATP-dependent DNA helicase RecQ [uncultured Campylobacterales bacterium]|uniref:DNA helicase RecQ n=1 Tax=uncultured Campylobacterales bacterium TaxID=352960 RepID=A0A6S6T1I3_9BACT|nr:MAG: ATP-dependent DNA helicase RecQ [uncultured Campylobacterales bacterium]